MTFNNRTALVTGAGRGIGKAIAEQLAKHGVTVICVSKTAANCGAVAAAIEAAGGKARALPVDVTDGAAVAKAAADLLAEYGAIDILVNNAGITRDGLLFRMSEDDWNAVLTTNLTSSYHWTKHLGRAMTQKRWGRIVNIASVVGLTGNAGQANYAAAKAGLIGLTKTAAREFGKKGVTVNAVAPGMVMTDMAKTLPPEILKRAVDEAALAELAHPDDIANAVLFLLSHAAQAITGEVLRVDAGQYI